MSTTSVLPAGALFAGDVRAYFAPMDRVSGIPLAFDPASMGRFELETPPAGWISAGAVASVKRNAGAGWKPVWSGAPAMVQSQGRSNVEETVEVVLPSWTRLAVALSSGMQTMNLLKTASGAAGNSSGGAAVTAESVGSDSTATVLHLPSPPTCRQVMCWWWMWTTAVKPAMWGVAQQALMLQRRRRVRMWTLYGV